MNYSADRLDDRLRQSQSANLATQKVAAVASLLGGRPLVQQKLSIDSANAPLLAKAIAPFAGNERKRGLTAAIYYSECCLHGVEPVDADIAAAQAMGLYEKWWVKTGFDCQNPQPKKRQKYDTLLASKEDSSTNKLRREVFNLLSDDDNSISSREQSVRRVEDICTIPIHEVSLVARYTAREISSCKTRILEMLRSSGGDTKTPEFLSVLEILKTSYISRGFDARWTGDTASSTNAIDGVWLTLSKSIFDESDGIVKSEESSQYRLGRLAFDMFLPTNLKCTIQTVFNTISKRQNSAGTHLPKLVCPTELQKEIFEAQANRPAVRNYE
jgi:hypothetical protein